MTTPVREKRAEKGLTVQQLSEQADISKATIYRIERGDTSHQIRIDTAEALASALGDDVNQLFSPGEVTHRGRPPHTGGKYTRNPDDGVVYGTLCTVCNLYYPAHAGCENCG